MVMTEQQIAQQLLGPECLVTVADVVNLLETLANGGQPEDMRMGVCAELRWRQGVHYKYIAVISADYPKAQPQHIKFVTDQDTLDPVTVCRYPVPGPDGRCAEEAYHGSKDKWSGDYGRERRMYCGWLARRLLLLADQLRTHGHLKESTDD